MMLALFSSIVVISLKHKSKDIDVISEHNEIYKRIQQGSAKSPNSIRVRLRFVFAIDHGNCITGYRYA